MTDTALVAQGLGKLFRRGLGLGETWALRDATFRVERGKAYGLLGSNGAGKTTAIHIALGLLRPSQGTIEILGRCPWDASARANVGFLPEAVRFDGFSAVGALLKRFDVLSGRPKRGREDRIGRAVNEVGLEAAIHQRVATLSKGTLQRLGLAAAILGDPELLILDEPLSGMDPPSRQRAITALRRRAERGLTTLLSSHVLAEVQGIVDHVIVLARGRVVADSSLSSFTTPSGTTTITYRGENASTLASTWEARGTVTTIERLAGGLCRVTVHDIVAKQAVIAALVQAGAEIVAVVPQSRSLEAAFLEITSMTDPSARTNRN